MNSRPTPWIQIFGPREPGLGNHNPVLAHLVSQFTIHFVPEITMGTIDDLEIELSVPLQSLDSSGLPALTPEQSRQAIDLVANSPDSWPDWTLAEGPEFLPAKPEPPVPRSRLRRSGGHRPSRRHDPAHLRARRLNRHHPLPRRPDGRHHLQRSRRPDSSSPHPRRRGPHPRATALSHRACGQLGKPVAGMDLRRDAGALNESQLAAPPAEASPQGLRVRAPREPDCDAKNGREEGGRVRRNPFRVAR